MKNVYQLPGKRGVVIVSREVDPRYHTPIYQLISIHAKTLPGLREVLALVLRDADTQKQTLMIIDSGKYSKSNWDKVFTDMGFTTNKSSPMAGLNTLFKRGPDSKAVDKGIEVVPMARRHGTDSYIPVNNYKAEQWAVVNLYGETLSMHDNESEAKRLVA